MVAVNGNRHYTYREFAAEANNQIGKPYVLGAYARTGEDNPKEFDCSELVKWLFRRSGNTIPDLAASQYDATVPVKGAIQPGDLVFLRNNPARWNGIGHVAVITRKLKRGGWKVVEARGRKDGVVGTTLKYWRKRPGFAGIRRLPGFKLAKNGRNGMRIAAINAYQPNIIPHSKKIPGWKIRRTRLVNLLNHESFDIICFNELSNSRADYLAKHMGGYQWFKAKGTNKAIAWKPSVVEFVEGKTYLQNPGTLIPLVRFAKDGTEFYCAAVHNSVFAGLKDVDRAGMRALVASHTPLVLAGDFNDTSPSFPPLVNTRGDTVTTNDRANSFHGFKSQKYNGRWIDHVLVSPSFGVTASGMVYTYKVRTSDHNIVWADIIPGSVATN